MELNLMNLTQLCDIDPMIDDLKVFARCISLWKSHPAGRPNEVYALDMVFQDAHVQMDFGENFDEEFVVAATELMPEYGVSCQLTDLGAGLTGGLLGIDNLLGDLTDFSLAAVMSKTLNT
nr:replication protein A 70 kDa DNA-binding subunit B [Tanacetum cinerariifolium]